MQTASACTVMGCRARARAQMQTCRHAHADMRKCAHVLDATGDGACSPWMLLPVLSMAAPAGPCCECAVALGVGGTLHVTPRTLCFHHQRTLHARGMAQQVQVHGQSETRHCTW